MANKVSIDFGATFVGDGASTSVVFSILTDPIVLASAAGGSNFSFLADALSAVPSGVMGLVVGGGLTVSSSSYNNLTKQLTINFTSAPSANVEYSVNGVFVF